MSTENKKFITIEATINAPVATVWEYWTQPAHITQWNYASDDWYTPRAESDFRPGGKFVYRMEARDGSLGFDFGGVTDEIIPDKYIAYTLGDGRKVKVYFESYEDTTKVKQIFEAEDENPIDLQQGGWQNILDNFKKYTEEK